MWNKRLNEFFNIFYLAIIVDVVVVVAAEKLELLSNYEVNHDVGKYNCQPSKGRKFNGNRDRDRSWRNFIGCGEGGGDPLSVFGGFSGNKWRTIKSSGAFAVSINFRHA
jgi:hypothetical protein